MEEIQQKDKKKAMTKEELAEYGRQYYYKYKERIGVEEYAKKRAEIRERAKEEKRFYCEECDKSFTQKRGIDYHRTSKKHLKSLIL